MATCRQCGAPLQEGTKFCSECGAPTESAPARMVAEPQIEYPTEKPGKRRKSIFRRWWFWALAVIVIAGIAGRSVVKAPTEPSARQTAPVVTSAPKATPGSTAEPTAESVAEPTVEPTAESAAEPTAEPSPEPQAAVAENEIRPEIKEFLDTYEAFIDEYADFMQKYMNTDSTGMVSMMGDYYSILARYT